MKTVARKSRPTQGFFSQSFSSTLLFYFSGSSPTVCFIFVIAWSDFMSHQIKLHTGEVVQSVDTVSVTNP